MAVSNCSKGFYQISKQLIKLNQLFVQQLIYFPNGNSNNAIGRTQNQHEQNFEALSHNVIRVANAPLCKARDQAGALFFGTIKVSIYKS